MFHWITWSVFGLFMLFSMEHGHLLGFFHIFDNSPFFAGVTGTHITSYIRQNEWSGHVVICELKLIPVIPGQLMVSLKRRYSSFDYIYRNEVLTTTKEFRLRGNFVPHPTQEMIRLHFGYCMQTCLRVQMPVIATQLQDLKVSELGPILFALEVGSESVSETIYPNAACPRVYINNWNIYSIYNFVSTWCLP